MSKITICGSIAFYQRMLDVKSKLEKLGHEVKLPPSKVKDQQGNLISVEEYYKIRKNAGKDSPKWIWERKSEAIKNHLKKIEDSENILVTNYDNKGIMGYIGSNTLIEIGVAFYLNKGIYLINNIPKLPSEEEIFGMNPIILNGNLSKIK